MNTTLLQALFINNLFKVVLGRGDMAIGAGIGAPYDWRA
jgi:hypothetical protein